MNFLITLISLLAVGVGALAAQDYGSRGNLWQALSEEERQEVDDVAERFKVLIGAARSELLMVQETIRHAEARGFRAWDAAGQSSPPSPGDKFYAVNRDRSIVLWVVGKEPLAEGMRLVNSHIDSIRLELKPHPLREQNGTVTLDTLVHGGLKAYQWTNVPLAMTGRIDLKNGETIWLDLGLKDDDPILLIPDLAPHVDRDYRDRTRADAIEREELDPVLISAPPTEDSGRSSLMEQALYLLNERYGIDADDWMSADIQIVPATPPRDVGLDRALIGAFGLDDRLTAVASLFAMDDITAPTHTAMAYMVTDEEVGSRWNIGVSSEWFRKLISEMVRAEKGSVTELDVMECFSKTHMVTADTTTAKNPLWPAPQAPDNAALMHHGLAIKLYGPGRSANSEFVAHLRRILDDANVGWQTHTYKAGYGGGTIASYFAGWNMEVTDWGVGIWSMHSTYDVASKADIWALYEGFVVFLRS